MGSASKVADMCGVDSTKRPLSADGNSPNTGLTMSPQRDGKNLAPVGAVSVLDFYDIPVPLRDEVNTNDHSDIKVGAPCDTVTGCHGSKASSSRHLFRDVTLVLFQSEVVTAATLIL